MGRSWVLVLGGLAVGVLAASACVEDRPAPPAALPDGGVAADGSAGDPGCTVPTAQPGNCSPSTEDWCFASDEPDAAPGCYPGGNAPESCVRRGIFACYGGGRRCSVGYPCCYEGIVRAAGARGCSRTLEPASTQCDFPDPGTEAEKRRSFGGRPCIDLAKRRRLGIVCENDAECQKYDAGACVRAYMPAPADVIIGVCADYDP